MKQLTGVLLGLVALVLVLSCQSNKRASNYNDKEALVNDSGLMFFTNATETSLTAVKTSGLAISNSKNQQIVQFAKMMINDHTQLAVDLKKLQTDNFVNSEDSINTTHQQIVAALEKKRAGEFDKAYLQEIVDENEQQITLYNTAGQNKNVNIADFAKKRLPALKAQLDSAKTISLTLK